jgi:hypothetical protein
MDDLAPYLLDAPDPNALFACPSAPELGFGYAMNQELAGRNVADFRGRSQTVLFFDSDADAVNAVGVPPPPPGPGLGRHMDYWNASEGQYDHYVFLNGEGGQTQPRPPGREGATQSAVAEALTCPAAPGRAHAYAINAAIAGRNATELADHSRLVLFFECDLNAPHAAGDPAKDAPAAGRHQSPWEPAVRQNTVGNLNGSTDTVAIRAPERPAP